MKHVFARNLHGLLLLMLMSSMQASSASIAIVDQQNPASSDGSQGGVVFGQSFIPTLSSIDAFDVVIGDTEARIAVQILDGVSGFDGLQAPVIGASDFVSVNTTSRQTFEFNFSGGVSLTPGNTYVARIFSSSGLTPPGIEGISITTGNSYTSGQLFEGGISDTTPYLLPYDAVFEEGLTATPEPSVFCIVGLGLLLSGAFPALRSQFLGRSAS